MISNQLPVNSGDHQESGAQAEAPRSTGAYARKGDDPFRDVDERLRRHDMALNDLLALRGAVAEGREHA